MPTAKIYKSLDENCIPLTVKVPQLQLYTLTVKESQLQLYTFNCK